MGFMRMRCVVQVRRFGGMKITGKLLSEILKAVCICRLKEYYLNLPLIFRQWQFNWISLTQYRRQHCIGQSDAVSP